MSNNRAFSRREERKARTEIPAVEDLGHKITMPRKTNRRAARTVASGDRFWDKSKVERKARKRTLEIQANRETNPVPHRLTRKQRQWMLAHLPGWSWDASGTLKAPENVTESELERLVQVTRLPYVQRAALRLMNMTPGHAHYVAERAPTTIRITLIEPHINGQRIVRMPYFN